MSPTTKQILNTALSLPASERDELIEALVAAQDEVDPGPLDEAWLAEIQRRSAEIDAGTVVLTPWPEVMHRVRQRIEARKDA